MTKFNVTIRADEKTLGPLLASLPQDTVPEIVRLKERPAPQKVVKPVANGDAKSAVLASVLADLPPEFKGTDFRELLSRHKFNPVSANHYLKQLRQRKLIRSTGLAGGMRYHKIKKD